MKHRKTFSANSHNCSSIFQPSSPSNRRCLSLFNSNKFSIAGSITSAVFRCNEEIELLQKNRVRSRSLFTLRIAERVKLTVSSRWQFVYAPPALFFPFPPLLFVLLFCSSHSFYHLRRVHSRWNFASLPDESRNISTHSCASCRSDLCPPAGLKGLLRLHRRTNALIEL